ASTGGAPAPPPPAARTTPKEPRPGRGRDLREGTRDASQASGARLPPTPQTCRPQRSPHEKDPGPGEPERSQRAVEPARPRSQNPRADLRRVRCGDGADAGARPAYPDGPPTGLDRGRADRGAAPPVRVRRGAADPRGDADGERGLRRDEEGGLTEPAV